MTSRFNALLVVLESEVREDDLDALVRAISQFRGVLSVQMTAKSGYEHQVAKMQVQNEMREKVWKVLTE